MSSETFNFKRFKHLAVNHFTQNAKKTGLYTLAIFGVMIIWSIFNGASAYSQINSVDNEIALFIASLFIFGCLWASLSFSDMGSRSGRKLTLMLPASMAEKFILRWILTVPAFLVLFLIASFFSDIARVLTQPDELSRMNYHYFIQFFSSKRMIVFIFVEFLFFQSIFFLGSIVWPKLSALKTLATLFIFVFVVFLLSGLIRQIVADTTISANLFDPKSWWTITFFLVATIYIYALSYMRFKESEIIQRW